MNTEATSPARGDPQLLVALHLFNTPAGWSPKAGWRQTSQHDDRNYYALLQPASPDSDLALLQKQLADSCKDVDLFGQPPPDVEPSLRTKEAGVRGYNRADEMSVQVAVGWGAADPAEFRTRLASAQTLAAYVAVLMFGWIDEQADPFQWTPRISLAHEHSMWSDPTETDHLIIAATTELRGRFRLWAAATTAAIEVAGAPGTSLSDLLVTDDRTNAPGPIPNLGIANARQRRHALRAVANEPDLLLADDGHDPGVAAHRNSTLVELQKAAEGAANYRNKMEINHVSVNIAMNRLRRSLGPSALLDTDTDLQLARLATVDGIVFRAQRAAREAERMAAHADATAQAAATDNNTLATLALTVVVGAATFAQLSDVMALQAAVGVLTATLLGSIGYQIALARQGSTTVRTTLGAIAVVGSVVAWVIAFQSHPTSANWIGGVGAAGNLLSLALYWNLSVSLEQARNPGSNEIEDADSPPNDDQAGR